MISVLSSFACFQEETGELLHQCQSILWLVSWKGSYWWISAATLPAMEEYLIQKKIHRWLIGVVSSLWDLGEMFWYPGNQPRPKLPSIVDILVLIHAFPPHFRTYPLSEQLCLLVCLFFMFVSHYTVLFRINLAPFHVLSGCGEWWLQD